MGIYELTTLIKENQDLFLKQHVWKQPDLVIDGPNILHYLFETNTDLENMYGGDYNKFATVIRNFFGSLTSCGVRPTVVMDGGHAVDESKLRTRIKRAEQRLQRVFSICRSGGNNGSTHVRKDRFITKSLPILGCSLFTEVLSDLGIEVHTCPFEADKDIAVIANEKGCPVLSYDSDFYVMHITGGFLPINYLEMKEREKNDQDPFSAKIYRVENFISQFPNLGMDVFPLLIALFGNDYTHKKDVSPFLESISTPNDTPAHNLTVTNGDQMKIIQWLLQVESFEAAKTQMASQLGKENLDRILKIIAMNYSPDKPTPPCPVPLPEWFKLVHEKSLIPSTFMTIITSQRIFLSCQPEDFLNPSSYICSKSLRQILYSILLRDSGETTVEEFDRKAGISDSVFSQRGNPCIIPEKVKVCDKIEVPGLVEIEAKTVHDRKKIFEAALQFDTFDATDPELNFLLGLTSFWYKNALHVKECHLSSLVVCWIFLEIEHRIINPTRPRNTNTIGKAVSGIDSQVLPNIYKKLSPYCAADTSPTKNTRLDIVHAFAQFQTCAISALDLYAILRLPFRFHVEYLFFGKFLHDFCIAIEKKPCRARDEFILGLLEAKNDLSDLYKNIIKKIRETKQPS